MLQRTAAYMKEHQMLPEKEPLVVGLSGGMDSVCLFYILKDLGYEFTAVHVHHGIRGKAADGDEAFVRKFCEKNNVPLEVFHFDVPGISKAQHLSEEEAGRMVRRKAFLEVMEKTGAKRVALAHHGNDRAETFLFHLARGAGIKGLGSMKPVQGPVIRPLLWAKRSQIEEYAAKNGYEYTEDATNASMKYTRNRLRHEVIPLLEQINPASVSHICGAAEKLSAAAEFIDREAAKLYTRCAVNGQNEVHLSEDVLRTGDPVLWIPVLWQCVEYLTGSLENMTEEHFQRITGLLELQTGRELSLPGELSAVRTCNGIRMYLKREKETWNPVEITGEGTFTFGGNTFTFSVEPWNERETFPTKTYTKCFDYDKIKDKLFLRTRKQGDFLEINQAHGRKSLQDYLINEKVPKDVRDETVLLADGAHIVWVIGKRISEYYKVTRETKRVLKVQVWRKDS